MRLSASIRLTARAFQQQNALVRATGFKRKIQTAGSATLAAGRDLLDQPAEGVHSFCGDLADVGDAGV